MVTWRGRSHSVHSHRGQSRYNRNSLSHARRRGYSGSSSYRRSLSRRSKSKSAYWHSQYKRPNSQTWKGKLKRNIHKSSAMKLTGQHISKYASKVTNSLVKYGVMENKVKVIQTPSVVCGYIGTSNTQLCTMGGMCYNLNQPISGGDATQATGFGAFASLEAFKLQRAPATTAATTAMNNNVLQGRYCFAKYLKLCIEIQCTPNLITSVANLASLGAEFLCPAIFRVLVVRKKPDSEINSIAPTFARSLFLSWAGPNSHMGLVNSTAETSEQPVEPKDVLYRPVNLSQYQVLKDFNFSMGFPSITGVAYNSKNVGYKRINLSLPINQKLEYQMGTGASSNVTPNNTDCDYSILIMSGIPGCNQAEMLSGSPTNPAVQPTLVNKWRSNVSGHFSFVDA